MSKKRTKQYLMLLMVVGLVSIAAGGGNGTFASFNAEVTNAGNTFASGTLFLHDTPNGGTTCTSESATTGPNFNINSTCTALFSNADLTGGPVTAHLALNNAGTINASALTFKVGSCSVGDNSANTTSSVVFGTAPTCGDLYMTVQQTASDYSTPVWCAYGPGSTTTTCSAPDNTATLADPTAYTNLKMDNGSGSATNATLAATATKYYVITIDPAGVTNDNQLQNRAVTFGLTWHLDQ